MYENHLTKIVDMTFIVEVLTIQKYRDKLGKFIVTTVTIFFHNTILLLGGEGLCR